LQPVSEWQCDKEDSSAKNADFSTLIGCHGNVLEKSEKKLNELNKPFHLSTHPEILVKIGLLASEKQVLERSTTEKIFKYKEKTSAKYIALSSSLPSKLNKKHVFN